MEQRKANNGSLAADLQSLLAPLSNVGGGALDLSLLACIPAKKQKRELNICEEHAMYHTDEHILSLFEAHIGPYTDLLENAVRHTLNFWRDAIFCWQTGCEAVNQERYQFPKCQVIPGPIPDPLIWVGLFFGRQAQETLKQGIRAEMDSDQDSIQATRKMERMISTEVKELSVLELMRNVLRYLREEWNLLLDADTDAAAETMLRFCALYGLSGAIKNVLNDKYGPSNGMTINTMLPFTLQQEASNDVGFPCFTYDDMYMPAWSFGAALGYRNVVRHCIQTLGAETDLKLVQKSRQQTRQVKHVEPLPPLMLYWAIKANLPEMVKCLVSEFGFQFRWLSDKMYDLYELLFHIDRSREEYGVWRTPRYNPHEMYGDRSQQRQFRAKCCLEEKQAMLRAMIEVGLPRQLFLPQLNVEVEQEMLDFLDKHGRKQAKGSTVQPFIDRLDRCEVKARERIYEAASEYNSTRDNSLETLTLLGFYKWAMNLWENQPTVQESRLEELEPLDPRWKRHEANGEEAFAPWWGQRSDYSSSDEYDSESYFSDESLE